MMYLQGARAFAIMLAGWLVLQSPASAQNCMAMPKGPERRACARQAHPEMFQARQDHCKELARERGDTAHTGTGAGGIREFVRDCMQGKQH